MVVELVNLNDGLGIGGDIGMRWPAVLNFSLLFNLFSFMM